MFVIGLIYIYSLTNKLLVLEIYAQFKDFSTELISYINHMISLNN